jgi:hypothetical protein
MNPCCKHAARHVAMSKSELYEAMRQESPGGLVYVAVGTGKDLQAQRAPLATLLDSAATAEIDAKWLQAPSPAPRAESPASGSGAAERARSNVPVGGRCARHAIAERDDDDDDDGPPKLVVAYSLPLVPALHTTASVDVAATNPRETTPRVEPSGLPARPSAAAQALAAPRRSKPFEALQRTVAAGVLMTKPAPAATRTDTVRPHSLSKPTRRAEQTAKERAAPAHAGPSATQLATRQAVRGRSGSDAVAEDGNCERPNATAARAASPRAAAGGVRATLTPARVQPELPLAVPHASLGVGAASDTTRGDVEGALALPAIGAEDDPVELAFDATDLANYLVALNPETYAALQGDCSRAMLSIAQFAIDCSVIGGRVNAVALRRMFRSGVLRLDVKGRPTVALEVGEPAKAFAVRAFTTTLQRFCGVNATGCPARGCALNKLELPAAVMPQGD